VHRIFAAADLALVPSRFEPCGLVQLYAQRYGAPPIAHATGGLIDTIVDCDAKLETGTGFLFEEPTADLFYAAVQRAIAAFATDRWPVLRRRVMRLDRGWERAGRQYEQLYRSLVATSAAALPAPAPAVAPEA
jgi:starch synthase